MKKLLIILLCLISLNSVAQTWYGTGTANLQRTPTAKGWFYRNNIGTLGNVNWYTLPQIDSLLILNRPGNNYIQNQSDSTQTNANFWIDGTGIFGTSLQHSLVSPSVFSISDGLSGLSASMQPNSLSVSNNGITWGIGINSSSVAEVSSTATTTMFDNGLQSQLTPTSSKDVVTLDYLSNYAPSTGGTGYIQNGTSLQTANYKITGTGTADSFVAGGTAFSKIINGPSELDFNGLMLGTNATAFQTKSIFSSNAINFSLGNGTLQSNLTFSSADGHPIFNGLNYEFVPAVTFDGGLLSKSTLGVIGATTSDPSTFMSNTAYKAGPQQDLTHNFTSYNYRTITQDDGTTLTSINIPLANGTMALTNQLTGGTVTSITPGYGFTSSTPITTTGTLTIDTAKLQTVSNFFTLGNTTYVPKTTTIAGFPLSSNIALANLSATNGSLTFSGTYNGSTARTIGLNLTNANTFTANQTAPAWVTTGGGNTQVVLGDGTLGVYSSGITGLANPTATIGLTAINGTATTAQRSDSAPALSQAITPTMTGIWNFTNLIGFKSSVPTNTITLGNTSTGFAAFNTVDQVTNFGKASLSWASNAYNITTSGGGSVMANDLIISSGGVGTQYSLAGNITVAGSKIYSAIGGTGINAANSAGLIANVGTLTASSLMQSFYGWTPTITQTSTAGYRGLWESVFENTIGSGVKLLIDLGTNSAASGSGTHTSKFSVDNTGKINSASLTASQAVFTDASKNLISANVSQIVAGADVTAQTAANASIATFTTSAVGVYRVGGYVKITAIATDVLEMQVTYTDPDGTAQTENFFVQGATSALLNTTGNYAFPTKDIQVNAGVAITIKTILTTGLGTITYKAGGTIEKLR